MSPKQVKITFGLARDRDAVVDPAHRDHADRTARPVDELDVRGQQVVDAVLVDRVRVAAADLHELVVAPGLDRGEDLGRHHAAQLGVAELVDVLRASSPTSATPACTSRRSPGTTGSTSAISTVLFVPSAAAHRASPRVSSTRSTCIGTPSSEHVMQWSPIIATSGARPSRSGCAPRPVHSITLALSSSSSAS